jgi:UDPglucose 6-dehydrogenase
MRVSVIGLGKLGAPLCAVLASKGHQVIGVDLNSLFVEAINQGKAPVEEPRLQELIDANKGRLTATINYEKAILGSDITFMIVPTPTDANGIFTNKYVIDSLKSIGAALRMKDGYHVVNITSTVMPGSCDGEIRDVLEASSGRSVGDGVGLCYNPEFIALGSVVHNMLNPDMILLGESDSRAGEMLASVYQSTCENSPPVMRMNLVNAELTKISVNTYVTTKISFANMLADICERLPGADVEVVTKAAGMDSRIGSKYLRGAIGFGGPCFPRDNLAFAKLAHSLGARPDLAEATDRLNNYQIDRLFSAAKKLLAGRNHVGILGLSYKPDTPVVEESQGVELAARLGDEGLTVTVYDPLALKNAMLKLKGKVIAVGSAEDCVKSADLVIIVTAWAEFRQIPASAFLRKAERVDVLDCWRLLPTELQSVANFHHIGRGALSANSI